MSVSRFGANFFTAVAIVALLLGGIGSSVAFNSLFALSFVAAAVAVVAPQYIVFSILSKSFARNKHGVAKAQRAFYFWSVRFSLSILLMVVVLRGLHESGLLQVPSFVGGVVGGVIFNIFWAARFSLVPLAVQSEGEKHGR